MKLQRINDERLSIKNLKNIRIAYALQTLGMMGILGYNFVTGGISGIKENPLWIVFVASTVILAFLSMSADERLVLKNLQKIRIAYAVQTFGIVVLLAIDFINKGGFAGVKENPLWFVFILSNTILVFLSMNISVDYENNKPSTGKEFIISVMTVTVISIIIGIFTSIRNGFNATDGILTASIFLICGAVPFLFLFGLRKRKHNES